jgi:hypothetical protein
MLLLREGETMIQLLTRLDLAIAKAFTEGTRTDEVKPHQPAILPQKINAHFRIQVDTSEPKCVVNAVSDVRLPIAGRLPWINRGSFQNATEFFVHPAYRMSLGV